MKIIGHRGAAGMALENTLESIRSAIRAGVDAVEIDVRLTKDGHLVLSHDKHTDRVSESKSNVHDSLLEELRILKLRNGKPIATLPEALRATRGVPLVIDAKETGWAQPVSLA